MKYRVNLEFLEYGEQYLKVQGTLHDEAHDACLDSIWQMLALLAFGDHKFDDDVIDRLTKRLDKFRNE